MFARLIAAGLLFASLATSPALAAGQAGFAVFTSLPGIPVVPGQSIGGFDQGFAGPGVLEPMSWALLVTGFAGVGLVLRTQRTASGAASTR